MPQNKTPLRVFGLDRLPIGFVQEFFKRRPQFRALNNPTTIWVMMTVVTDPELIHSKRRLQGVARLRNAFCDLWSEESAFVIQFAGFLQDHWRRMPVIEKFLTCSPIVIKPSGKLVRINDLTDGEIARMIQKRFHESVTKDAVKKARQKLASGLQNLPKESVVNRPHSLDSWFAVGGVI